MPYMVNLHYQWSKVVTVTGQCMHCYCNALIQRDSLECEEEGVLKCNQEGSCTLGDSDITLQHRDPPVHSYKCAS